MRNWITSKLVSKLVCVGFSKKICLVNYLADLEKLQYAKIIDKYIIIV